MKSDEDFINRVRGRIGGRIVDFSKMALEYTDEIKSITIPAGVSIMDKGVEGNLSAIKEGQS